MPPRVSALVTVILLAILGAAGSFIFHRLENPPQLALLAPSEPPLDPLLDAARVGGAAEQFIVGPITQYQETVQRPLFSNTRRPPPPPRVKPEEPEEMPEPELEDEREHILIGVMLTSDATTALIKDDRNKVSRVRLGDKIDGWELAQVNPESVVLNKGSRTKELLLLRNQQPQIAGSRQQQAPITVPPQPSGQEDPRELRRRLLQQHRALRQKMEREARNQPQAVPRASATN